MKRKKWEADNKLCMTALRKVVKGNLYIELKRMIIAKECYNHVVAQCQPKGHNSLFNTYAKFETLKSGDCESITQYDIKFREIINEYNEYSGNERLTKI